MGTYTEPKKSMSVEKHCLMAAEQMAEEKPSMHERTLFIITAMYLIYLRISEFVAHPLCVTIP